MVNADGKWFVTIEDGATGETETRSCKFLHGAPAIIIMIRAINPISPGLKTSKGRLCIRNFGRKIWIIVAKKCWLSAPAPPSLVPAMAETAEHVAMLQRSPTYIVSRPSEDAFANFTRKCCRPPRYGLTRWKNVLLGRFSSGCAAPGPNW